MAKFFTVEKKEDLIQVFPEICRNSCSKNNELRDFNLYKTYTLLTFGKLKIRGFRGVKLVCNNCKWQAKLPSNFSKHAFKNGLRPDLLMEFSKNKVLSSRFLVMVGGLWRVWLFTLVALVLVTIFRFQKEAIVVGQVPRISFDEAISAKYLGKIVEIQGKVDYTASILQEEIIYRQNAGREVLKTEAYLPLTKEGVNKDFFVIRGGEETVKLVKSKANLKDEDLLINQDFTIKGRVDSIESISDEKLKRFFLVDYPQRKSYDPPQIVINESVLKPLNQFVQILAPYYIAILILFVCSLSLQIYIDRKIVRKYRLQAR